MRYLRVPLLCLHPFPRPSVQAIPAVSCSTASPNPMHSSTPATSTLAGEGKAPGAGAHGLWALYRIALEPVAADPQSHVHEVRATIRQCRSACTDATPAEGDCDEEREWKPSRGAARIAVLNSASHSLPASALGGATFAAPLSRLAASPPLPSQARPNSTQPARSDRAESRAHKRRDGLFGDLGLVADGSAPRPKAISALLSSSLSCGLSPPLAGVQWSRM
jgi:hypothetical protein